MRRAGKAAARILPKALGRATQADQKRDLGVSPQEKTRRIRGVRASRAPVAWKLWFGGL